MSLHIPGFSFLDFASDLCISIPCFLSFTFQMSLEVAAHFRSGLHWHKCKKYHLIREKYNLPVLCSQFSTPEVQWALSGATLVSICTTHCTVQDEALIRGGWNRSELCWLFNNGSEACWCSFTESIVFVITRLVAVSGLHQKRIKAIVVRSSTVQFWVSARLLKRAKGKPDTPHYWSWLLQAAVTFFF